MGHCKQTIETFSPFDQILVLLTEKQNEQEGEKTSLESSCTLKTKEPQFALCPLGTQKGLALTITLPHATGEMSKIILKGERTLKRCYSVLLVFCPSAFLHPSMVKHLLLCFCFTDRLAHVFARACHPQRLLS